MKILSWNVNGLRARIKTGFEDTIKRLDPDIVCIQETRCTPAQLPANFMSDYVQIINNHDKAGYAGCGTWIKTGTDRLVETKIISGENGRALLTTIDDSYHVVNAYVPNSGLKLERLDGRIAWHQNFFEDLMKLKESGKPIIYTGDLNCAYSDMEVGSKYIKSGITPQERKEFCRIMREIDLCDIWRKFHPNRAVYTWFSNQFNSKSVNRGMRIDYFLISESIKSQVSVAEIISDDELVIGSDHQILFMEVDI